MVAEIGLNFSGEVDPATAENLANYQLFRAGRDRKLGTKDDRAIRIKSARFNTSARRLVITPARRLQRAQKYRLVVTGLKDASGRSISPIDLTLSRRTLVVSSQNVSAIVLNRAPR